MSTVAQRVQLGPFFSGGTLQGAAKLYHYNAGLATLKNIWEDRAQVTTLAQPLVADSNGVFNFFADGLYKLIICGPNSTGPTVDVLYTLDNWQFLDPQADILWSEGAAIASASSIALGSEVWNHISGSTDISTITMTTPFAWLVFDGNLTLTASANLLTPAGIDLAVRQNDVLFLLNEGSSVVRVAGHYPYDGMVIATQDSRTNSVDVPLTVRSTTSGTPAAGIGTGILLQAESGDEAPSDTAQLEAAYSDVGAGTEDTYFQILLRVAGAALTACWRFASTATFKAILTHANTADRTYTFPNASYVIDAGEVYKGPSSCGSGSTRSHEGTVTVSSNGNYSGIHFYTDFTLNSGVTMTVPAGKRRLVIIASGIITINGTISAVGAGAATQSTAETKGNSSTAASGGGGDGVMSGNGSGGDQVVQGIIVTSGGTEGQNGVGNATAGSQTTGSDNTNLLNPLGCLGGASGGCGAGGTGGAGGGSIILIAPTIVLANTATLNTSGAAGTGAAGAAGGGGGAGNVYILTRSYTDNGATFTLTGGSYAGVARGGGDGMKQINIYS